MRKRKKRINLKQCPVATCRKYAILHRHHYLPQRHWGDNPFYILICDECHEKIEQTILRVESFKKVLVNGETKKLTEREYFQIVYNFVYGRTK